VKKSYTGQALAVALAIANGKNAASSSNGAAEPQPTSGKNRS
jgi:hypothetical protein